MIAEPYVVSPGQLPDRLPQRASALLVMFVASGPVLAVQDGHTGAFSSASALRAGRDRRVLGLSEDGTTILMSDHENVEDVRVGGYHLPTATYRWTTVASQFIGVDAAASVDGRTVAFLRRDPGFDDDDESEPDTISLCEADPETASVRTLWSGPGCTTPDSSVAYSPAGRYLVATFDDPPMDEWVKPNPGTVVIDRHQGSVTRLADLEMLPPGGHAWIADTTISCELHAPAPAEDHLHAVNLVTGERRALGLAATRPPARVGDRFVLRRRPRHQYDHPWLDTVTFDDEDPRPFLTVSEPCSIMSVHIAHLAAPFA